MSAPTDADFRVGMSVLELGGCNHNRSRGNPRHLISQTFGDDRDCFHYQATAVQKFEYDGGILVRNWQGYVKRLPEGSYARQNRQFRSQDNHS